MKSIQTVRRIVADPDRPGLFKTCAVAVRDDPVVLMHSRRDISDAQFMAASVVRLAFELVHSSGLKSVDASSPYVDGGLPKTDSPNVQRSAAASKLARARVLLGEYSFQLISSILADGVSISTLASQEPGDHHLARRYIGKRFRDALDELAVLFDLVAEGQPTKSSAGRAARSPSMRTLTKFVEARASV